MAAASARGADGPGAASCCRRGARRRSSYRRQLAAHVKSHPELAGRRGVLAGATRRSASGGCRWSLQGGKGCSSGWTGAARARLRRAWSRAGGRAGAREAGVHVHRPRRATVGDGQGLHEVEPVFRAALDECAGHMDRHLAKPLLQVMFAECQLPVAGRRRTVSSRGAYARHRTQAGYGGRIILAGGSGMHGRMLLGSSRSGEL